MFMMNEHTISMWKNIAASILLSLILIPFIMAGFFEISILLIILLFSLYQMIIIQYYEINGRMLEFKDLMFSICFMFIFYLLCLLFHIALNSDQLMILFSAIFIFGACILALYKTGCLCQRGSQR